MPIKALRVHHANVRLPEASEHEIHEFYGRVLGLTPDPNVKAPNVIHWLVGESGSEVHMKFGPTPTLLKSGEVLPNHFALVVDDLEETKRELTRQGVPFWQADIRNPEHEIFVKDPAGNVVELQEAH